MGHLSCYLDCFRCLGYVCVRYSGIPLGTEYVAPPCLVDVIDEGAPISWVGHCVVTSANVDQMTGQMVVSMKLQQSSVPLPQALLTQPLQQPDYYATIEWIPKALLARYVLLFNTCTSNMSTGPYVSHVL